MEQDRKNGNLSQIREEFRHRLSAMRYSDWTAQSYSHIFNWVEKFLIGYGEPSYSKEWGRRFLAEYLLQPGYKPSQYKIARIVIRKMDEILEGREPELYQHGPKAEWPSRFASHYDGYFACLAARGLKTSTIKNHERYTSQLLFQLPTDVNAFEGLTAGHLYAAFKNWDAPGSKLSTARSLLVFLFEAGVTGTDLSVCVPSPRRPEPLPSIYTGAEIERLLSAINREDSIGKRDYAVLMLAAYTGLRSSDIVSLSFTDVDYAGKAIRIVQTKTSNPVTIVLNDNVQEALDDYIRNGRSASAYEKIFLSSKAPYRPLSAKACYAITKRWFGYANIPSQGRRQGPRALRASYATALITKGVPYVVVKEALGHSDQESSKYYVRADVRRLRSCALDVPKPSGAFAALLDDLEVL